MKLRVAVPGRLADGLRRFRPAAAAAPSGTGGLAARAPQLATVLLAAAVAAQLALLAWRFVPGATPAPAVPVPSPPPATRSVDVGTILAAQLFGRAPTPQASAEDAPRTQVPLVLVGTIAAADPAKGLAILGESPAAARVYSVGATVPGGVKLHSVYADRVVLERGGALETLPLPRQIAAGTGIAAPAPVAAPAPAPAGAPGLAESVQRLVAQPEVVGELIRPMPDFANGQLRGFRLYPGRDRQKFAQLGLQAGDLVTEVNGVPLSDPQRGMEILRGMGSAGTATVTLERNGSVQQVTVTSAQIETLNAQSSRQMVQPPRADRGGADEE